MQCEYVRAKIEILLAERRGETPFLLKEFDCLSRHYLKSSSCVSDPYMRRVLDVVISALQEISSIQSGILETDCERVLQRQLNKPVPNETCLSKYGENRNWSVPCRGDNGVELVHISFGVRDLKECLEVCQAIL